MSIGIIEALRDGYVTFEDLPTLSTKLRERFEKILKEIEDPLAGRPNLQELLLRENSVEMMEHMISQGEIIFTAISNERFSHTYGWIEAKDAYWNTYKNQNLKIFGNHKTYNMILDGLEKIYGRHLPRKTEHLPEIVRMLEIAKYKQGIEEHYFLNKDFIDQGESGA